MRFPHVIEQDRLNKFLQEHGINLPVGTTVVSGYSNLQEKILCLDWLNKGCVTVHFRERAYWLGRGVTLCRPASAGRVYCRGGWTQRLVNDAVSELINHV